MSSRTKRKAEGEADAEGSEVEDSGNDEEKKCSHCEITISEYATCGKCSKDLCKKCITSGCKAHETEFYCNRCYLRDSDCNDCKSSAGRYFGEIRFRQRYSDTWFLESSDSIIYTGFKRLQQICHEAYKDWPLWHNSDDDLKYFKFLPRDALILKDRGLCVICGYENKKKDDVEIDDFECYDCKRYDFGNAIGSMFLTDCHCYGDCWQYCFTKLGTDIVKEKGFPSIDRWGRFHSLEKVEDDFDLFGKECKNGCCIYGEECYDCIVGNDELDDRCKYKNDCRARYNKPSILWKFIDEAKNNSPSFINDGVPIFILEDDDSEDDDGSDDDDDDGDSDNDSDDDTHYSYSCDDYGVIREKQWVTQYFKCEICQHWDADWDSYDKCGFCGKLFCTYGSCLASGGCEEHNDCICEQCYLNLDCDACKDELNVFFRKWPIKNDDEDDDEDEDDGDYDNPKTCVLCDSENDWLELIECQGCKKFFHYSIIDGTCNDVCATGKCIKCEKVFCGVEDCEDCIYNYDYPASKQLICRGCVNNDSLWEFMVNGDYTCYESAVSEFNGGGK